MIANLLGVRHSRDAQPTYRVSAEYSRPNMDVVSRVMV